MKKKASKRPIDELEDIMARLRSPTGCPWDREQDHMSLRTHAIEEVYELLDAIEADDDHLMVEELGDLLLQVIFHSQLAAERQAFDFDEVCRQIVEKLIRRHPHVFGTTDVDSVDAVWAQWEQIKKAEKAGTRHQRPSVLDGIPRHLPALMRAEKLLKKARKADLVRPQVTRRRTRRAIAHDLFELAADAQSRGWSAEQLLREETKRRERALRAVERRQGPRPRPAHARQVTFDSSP